MTKPVWSHVLSLNAWADTVICQEASVQIANICMQVKFITN